MSPWRRQRRVGGHHGGVPAFGRAARRRREPGRVAVDRAGSPPRTTDTPKGPEPVGAGSGPFAVSRRRDPAPSRLRVGCLRPRGWAAGPVRRDGGTAAAAAAAPASAGAAAGAALALGRDGRGGRGDDHRHAAGLAGAGDPAQLGVAGPDPVVVGGDPGVGHQPRHLPALVGQHQGDHGAGLPRAGGAAAAVQVVLVVGRRVDVHHQVQVVHVDAAGGDIGGDQGGDVAVLELLQHPVALRLGLAAVQRGRADAVGEQLLGQLVGGVLGVHEHDHPALAGRDLHGHGALVGVGDIEHMVLHGGDGAGRGIHRMGDRVGEEAADQAVHVAVQGGREQHRLAVRADLLQQIGDLRQEAHVGHLVGLVQDADGHPVQPGVAAVDQVLQPARGGDQHLDAAAQRTGLAADGHAADHRGQPQVHGGGVGGERVGDLLRQLAGRHQHQGQRRLGLGTAAGGTGQQGQAEGQGLAGAGAAAAEDVASGQGVGQGRGLDRERLDDALAGQRRQQATGHVQLAEGRDRRKRRGGAHGHLELALRCRVLTAARGALLRTAAELAAAATAAAGARPGGAAEAGGGTRIVGTAGAMVHREPSS